MVGVDIVHSFRMKEGLREVSFARRFRTPDGISRRVTGVWILALPMYFNCCPFFLKTPNFRSLLGNQLTFISMRGIFLPQFKPCPSSHRGGGS